MTDVHINVIVQHMTHGGYSQGKTVHGYRHTLFELRASFLINYSRARASSYQHIMYLSSAGECAYYFDRDELMRIERDSTELWWLE